jgi:hypothetical protein
MGVGWYWLWIVSNGRLWYGLWVLLPDSWFISRMDLMEMVLRIGVGDETGVELCSLRAVAVVLLNL